MFVNCAIFVVYMYEVVFLLRTLALWVADVLLYIIYANSLDCLLKSAVSSLTRIDRSCSYRYALLLLRTYSKMDVFKLGSYNIAYIYTHIDL